MRKLITILILTLTAISCGKIKDAHNTLNDIETFINERPDSALTILDSFDTSLLENKSIWAHHSLLHAQAKDKCYIDETDDSLMTQVVNYYEGKRDKERLFKAHITISVASNIMLATILNQCFHTPRQNNL